MSNQLLKIAKGVNLPLEVVTQTIAILAKRRAGKSYTMRKIAEELLDKGQQIVLVDPKGDQWGIRSSADGKAPGYPIVILGGEHGDIPLEVDSGELIAKLVVEERVSVLLDLSEFRKHEIATFMAIFLENLYRLKAKEIYRTPVMVIVDEADAIAPQKPQANEARMLGAIDDIVRRGGQRGIGCILITQRSAVLNKNVLTQAQILVVLRTIAPQDLAAMKAWIEVHGDLSQGKKLIESLPSLPIGEAWFWSPGWPTADGIFVRARVLPIVTFDSGATPKPGERQVVPKNLADIDLGVLKEKMAATIEKAKSDDPKELKKEIARLNKLISENSSGDVDAAVSTALAKRDKEWGELMAAHERWAERLEKVIVSISEAAAGALDVFSRPATTLPDIQFKPFKQKVTVVRDGKPAPAVVTGERAVPVLKSGARRMIEIIVDKYPLILTKTQLGTLAGLKVKSGTFAAYLSALRSNELISTTGNAIAPTEKAFDEFGKSPRVAISAMETREMWRSKLKTGAQRMFDVLNDFYPNSISKEMLAEISGIDSKGGTFAAYLSTLRSNGLVTVDGQDVTMSADLFID
jgi:uncharacterized protein